MTEEGDIGFGVYFSECNDEKIELVPVERVDSHLQMEEGEVVCSKRCTCRFCDAFLRKIISN